MPHDPADDLAFIEHIMVITAVVSEPVIIVELTVQAPGVNALNLSACAAETAWPRTFIGLALFQACKSQDCRDGSESQG